MTTSQAAFQRWDEIFKQYGLPVMTGNKHYTGPCPLCGKKGKFRIDNRNGNGEWICVCGFGNGFELLIQKTGKEFEDVCRDLDKFLGNVDEQLEHRIKTIEESHLNALGRYNSMIKIEKSPCEIYLRNRGITTLPKYSVRYSYAEYAISTKSNIPAMFALAVTENNKIKYSHCTFLIGNNKANIDTPKQLNTIQEYSGSLAIKLFSHKDVLGIAEGIETALSACQMFKVPTWSVLNTTFMKRFVAPKDLKVLYVFADNDTNGSGLAAAFTCGRNNIIRNSSLEKVHILWPLRNGDFNDIITDVNPSIMKWTLNK